MNPSLVVLLHLCDSLFPLGSFAHSDGLEAATSSGDVRTAADVRAWLETTFDEPLCGCDAATVLRAWQAWERHDSGSARDLDAIDAEVHAIRPSAAGRDAARAMGTRLIKTWQQIRPDVDLSRLSEVTARGLSLPTAFGVVTCASGIDAGNAVSGFIYARLAATLSAAMRLMPLGQHEGHAMLAAVLARVPERVDQLLSAPALAPRSFAPAMDIAAMSQQYGQSRLFRS